MQFRETGTPEPGSAGMALGGVILPAAGLKSGRRKKA